MKNSAYWLMMALTIGLSLNGQAQSVKAIETPKWVTMMEDPNVNFFEAVSVYQEYWKTHQKPTTEAETFEHQAERSKDSNQSADEKEKTRLAKLGAPLSGQELESYEYIKYQSKRFDKWMVEVKPWVQENGHILTYEERQNIWKQQQEEIRQQDKKN